MNTEIFLSPYRKLQRDRQNVQNVQYGLRPGVPKRAQQRREKGKRAGRTQQRGKQRIKRQPARIHTQGEKEKPESRRKAVKRVKRLGKAGAAEPQGAQQIIEQRKSRPQRKGDQQRTELCRIVNAHA